jgi:hypothetical protein
MKIDLHLALEVLHDIQKNVVDIRAFMKLDLDGIEVAKRVRNIELTVYATVQTLRRGLSCRLQVILPLCIGRLQRSYYGCGCRDAGSISRGVQGGCGRCCGLSVCLRSWQGWDSILGSAVYRRVHGKDRAEVSLCED